MTRWKPAVAIVLACAATAQSAAQGNSAPSAILDAPGIVDFGAPLQLSGVRSADPDGKVTRYVWTRIEGSGGGMPLNMPVGTLEPTYVVPQPAGRPLAVGRHRFQLFVNDDSGNRSTPVEVAVIVADRSAPSAVLDAPDAIDAGASLQLSGARSTDVGGRVVRYAWTRLEGGGGGAMPLNQPVVTEGASYTVPQPAGQALATGRHRFRLSVTDDSGNQSQPADRLVLVLDRIAPTAVLDAPRQATQIVPFQLSGSRSTDTGGRIVQYQWTRLSGGANGPLPLGQPVVTDKPALLVNQSPTSYLGIGRQVFRLVVVDDSGNQSVATDVAVDVIAPLPGGLTK